MAEIEEKEVATADRETDLPIPDILPVLPLKDVVVFPYIILPLSVSREKSINAVDAALAEQRIIMLVAQKDAQNDAPRPEDLYPVGTVAAIMRMLKLPDGRIRLLVQGLSRARARLDPRRRAVHQGQDHAPRGDRAERGAAARARGAPAQRQAEPGEVRLARQEHLSRGHGHRRRTSTTPRGSPTSRPRTSTSSSRRRRRSWSPPTRSSACGSSTTTSPRRSRS